MTEDACFSLTRDERGVGYLEIKAGKMNILGSPEIVALTAAITALATDDALRCLVIRGGERAFVGGANIKEMATLTPALAEAFISRLHALCESVRTLPVPVVARIHGWCLGGGVEFAAACDIQLASDESRFAMPEVKLGIPSVVHAAMLPGLIGTGRTRWWLLTGEIIDAAKALSWGLLDTVVPLAELDAEVERTVSGIVECPPPAIRTQKTLCNAWDEVPLAQGTRLSIEPFGSSFATGEPGEAMTRFLTKGKSR